MKPYLKIAAAITGVLLTSFSSNAGNCGDDTIACALTSFKCIPAIVSTCQISPTGTNGDIEKQGKHCGAKKCWVIFACKCGGPCVGGFECAE